MKFSTILANLASNANKAMTEGGIFTLRTGTEAGNAFLSIAFGKSASAGGRRSRGV